jgi:hypothetical protein
MSFNTNNQCTDHQIWQVIEINHHQPLPPGFVVEYRGLTVEQNYSCKFSNGIYLSEQKKYMKTSSNKKSSIISTR